MVGDGIPGASKLVNIPQSLKIRASGVVAFVDDTQRAEIPPSLVMRHSGNPRSVNYVEVGLVMQCLLHR
jgi:hypothetical protein